MKSLHVASSSGGGGAAIAAQRLHQGLLRANIDSQMYVAHRTGADPTIQQVTRSKKSFLDRLRQRVGAAKLKRERNAYKKTRSPQLEAFSDDRVPGRDRLSETLPAADVYNLHWVAGFLDYSRFFRRVNDGTPVVWTLHDMNPFTGGCHYTLGCEKFAQSCGACRQLGSTSINDISARIHRRKAAALARLNPATTCIVATSRWLQSEAARSSLLSRFRVELIPYGLDTDVFIPRRRDVARELFGLPADDLVVLFVADSVSNHRKGFDLLQAALHGLAIGRPLTLAAIGHNPPVDAGAVRFASLGRIDNERMMSFAFSAADVFVFPTRAEAFGQVAFEAMACGTPVVGFDVGGVPDIVRPGQTGLLAPPENVAELRNAIVAMLTDGEMRARMSAECRRVAVEDYALGVQARRYIALYEELIETGKRQRRGITSRAIA